MLRERTVFDKSQGQHCIRVEVIGGPDRGLVCERPSAQITFGTSQDNDVVLADSTISRYHMEIRGGRGVWVTDLGSEGGVFVNDIQIHEAIVPLGTSVKLGATVLLLLEGGPDDSLPPPRVSEVPGIVATSPVMRALARTLEQMAQSNAPVLMQGEVGTGKEYLARAIHDASPRASAPFVVVASHSIAPAAVAAHLFVDGGGGNPEGRPEGAFEQASGGSIYFDEVGELPRSAQLALLDVLDSQTSHGIDGADSIPPATRVFAATRRDLRAEANQGSFQADLYVRLATTRIDVPPLRERQEDLEELIEQLARDLTGVPESPFSESALQLLRVRFWSGNIRELRDVVESALLTRSLAPDSIEPPASDSFLRKGIVPYRLARGAAIASFERNYLSQLIEACGGNASGAARAAEMDRPYLLSLLRKHGLR